MLGYDYYNVSYNIDYIFLVSEFHIFNKVVTFCSEKSNLVIKHPFVYFLFILILYVS